jgi:flagellar biosynthesis protein FlhB
LTNAIQNFIAGEWGKGFVPPSRIEETFIFILLILNLIRFFYGNWMSLEKTFDRTRFEGKAYLINFVIVISQSIAFTVLSFYKQLYPFFFIIFVAGLFIDVLGFGLLLTTDDRQRLRLQIRWLFNNLWAAIALSFIINPAIANQQIIFWAAICVSSLNTIAGFWISWQFYLPVNVANTNQ